MLMASSSPEFPAGLIVPVCFLYRANSNAGNEEHFALGNWCRVKHYQYRFQILGNPWQCPAAPFCLPSCSSHAPLLLLTSPPPPVITATYKTFIPCPPQHRLLCWFISLVFYTALSTKQAQGSIQLFQKHNIKSSLKCQTIKV